MSSQTPTPAAGRWINALFVESPEGLFSPPEFFFFFCWLRDKGQWVREVPLQLLLFHYLNVSSLCHHGGLLSLVFMWFRIEPSNHPISLCLCNPGFIPRKLMHGTKVGEDGKIMNQITCKRRIKEAWWSCRERGRRMMSAGLWQVIYECGRFRNPCR